MEDMDIVKAYFAALDSPDPEQARQYLSEEYQLVDFTALPLDQAAMFGLINHLKAAFPNLKHSLSNICAEGNVVKLGVQLSGTNSGDLDLREMGIGVVALTKKFIIFPNGNYEFTLKNSKITMERDVSPKSPNRRISGMLKALGVNIEVLQISQR